MYRIVKFEDGDKIWFDIEKKWLYWWYTISIGHNTEEEARKEVYDRIWEPKKKIKRTVVIQFS